MPDAIRLAVFLNHGSGQTGLGGARQANREKVQEDRMDAGSGGQKSCLDGAVRNSAGKEVKTILSKPKAAWHSGQVERS
jgi:hypothetical protein